MYVYENKNVIPYMKCQVPTPRAGVRIFKMSDASEWSDINPHDSVSNFGEPKTLSNPPAKMSKRFKSKQYGFSKLSCMRKTDMNEERSRILNVQNDITTATTRKQKKKKVSTSSQQWA